MTLDARPVGCTKDVELPAVGLNVTGAPAFRVSPLFTVAIPEPLGARLILPLASVEIMVLPDSERFPTASVLFTVTRPLNGENVMPPAVVDIVLAAKVILLAAIRLPTAVREPLTATALLNGVNVMLPVELERVLPDNKRFAAVTLVEASTIGEVTLVEAVTVAAERSVPTLNEPGVVTIPLEADIAMLPLVLDSVLPDSKRLPAVKDVKTGVNVHINW